MHTEKVFEHTRLAMFIVYRKTYQDYAPPAGAEVLSRLP